MTDYAALIAKLWNPVYEDHLGLRREGAAALAAMQDKIEQLRLDAERYRKVRDLMRIGPHGEWVAIIGDEHTSEAHKQRFDAAIDAANAKEKP